MCRQARACRRRTDVVWFSERYGPRQTVAADHAESVTMRTNPFALLLVGLMVVGGAYGYVSALRNANPHRIQSADPTVTAEELRAGKAWRPSPLWLPSHLVCTVPKRTASATFPSGDSIEAHIVGYGLENRDNRGYAFSSTMKRSRYRIMSTAVGVGFGVIVAAVIGLATGMVTVRRKSADA